MSDIKVVFEEDSSLGGIEITVRAPRRDAEIDALLSRLSPETQPPPQLSVTDENGAVRMISPDEVFMVSVNGKTLSILTENECFTARRSLQSIEDVLCGGSFIRISRYELVNLSKVKHYDFTLRGTLRLEFQNGMETWASRRCIAAIRKRLKGE